MSTAQLPRPSRPAEAPRRRFVIVPSKPQRRRRPRVLHAVVAVTGLLVIVGAQLLISIAISGGAYTIQGLEQHQRTLQRQQLALDEQVQIHASTQFLAQAAAALGMVPATQQYYLDLTSGKVTKAPSAADPWGCGGDCNLATNTLIAGLPLPGGSATDDVSSVDGAGAATAVGDPDSATSSPVDPDAPVVADQLPAVVTH